jgi:DNA polymerase-1
VAPRYLRLKPWKHIAETKGHADPFYSAKDAFVEYHLASALSVNLADTGMESLFQDIMMPAVPVLMDMEKEGIRVNGAYAEKWCGELATSLNTYNLAWVERHPDVSPTSHPQLRKLFYDQWKCRPIYRRGTRTLRVDEYAMRKIAANYPMHREDIGLLRNIAKTGKMLSTFGQGVTGVDRVYPKYLPASRDDVDDKGKGIAGTGRLASHDPNLQQQPPEARKLYLPDRDDMCFIEFDWSQAELRVGAALSGDEAMQEALKGDIHAYTMARMNCDRTRAKNVLFGSAYGGGPRKLKEELESRGFEITLKECTALQTQLAETYPKWWAWRETVAQLAASQQYLRNPFGRLRRFPVKNVPVAMNYLPQSTVADMAWSCYRPVSDKARKYGGRLITSTHDSFLIQADCDDMTHEVVNDIAEILEQPFDNIAPGFKCPVSIKVGAPGASWGELE